MRRLPLLIVGLALLAAVGGYALQRAQQAPSANAPAAAGITAGFAAGAPLPALVLRDLQGRARRLDAWRGRWLLVNFWAPWCPPCRQELPVLRAAQQRFGGRLKVIGIAEDSVGHVRAFLARMPLDYPVLLAGTAHPGLAFGNAAQFLPYSVLVAPDGRLLKRHYGAFSEQSLNAWLPHTLQ